MRDEKNASESHFNREYGKGFNMLKKMGFKSGTGLGPSGDGIMAPIEVSMRKPGEGLQDDEGSLIKPSSTSMAAKKLRRRKREKESDSDGTPEDDSSSSEIEMSVVELSEEELLILDARKEADALLEKRRELEYRAYNLGALLETGSGGSEDSLSPIIYDMVESGILSQSLKDPELFRRVVSVLRDKYDSNPLWYELEAEGVISAAVSEMVNEITDKVEVDGVLIEMVHELVIDDDHFSRILEFQLIPAPALKPVKPIFQAIRKTASPLHYQSIYSRLLDGFFKTSLKTCDDSSFLVCEDWMQLVPVGESLNTLIQDHVVPRSSHATIPKEVVAWKAYLSEEQWKDVVYGKAIQLLELLKPISVSDRKAFNLLESVVEWAEVVSPCVVGLLLVESGFLPKWLELNKLEPDILRKECRAWFPLLGKVGYHSPAKKIITEALRIARGELENTQRRPAGPPPGFFAKTSSHSSDKSKVTLGDVLREEARRRNVLLVPKPGVREQGIQVFKIGNNSVFWKEDSVFLQQGIVWTEVALDSVFR